MPSIYMVRERLHGFFGLPGDYMVKIKGKRKEDDGLYIDMGNFKGAWHEVPLPACPDCKGKLVWDEAGNVPGTRRCEGCGSMFSVRTRPYETRANAPVALTNVCDNNHRWTESEGDLCPKCGQPAI